jgi:predicted small lipoprotein YifL
MKRFALCFALTLAVAACGTKSDLTRPDGKPAPADTQDPSKPPRPIGGG